jgi:hypothetical protein
MSLVRRVLAAILIFVAGLGELIFAGGQVAMCLGPLGVTPIQCAKVTGIVPTTPIAVPLFALVIASGVLLLAPVRAGRRRTALVAGAIASGAAGIALSSRPGPGRASIPREHRFRSTYPSMSAPSLPSS